MAQRKAGDCRLAWAQNFEETIKRMHRQEMRSWLQPKSGDLLRDVTYLQRRTEKEGNRRIRGIYARAAIVMSVATIEAVTNDALATIYELLMDTVPSECAREPPWCSFMDRSSRRVAALLKKGSFTKKRAYVLSQIERVRGEVPEPELIKEIERLVLFRNRIVHMSYQERPDRYRSMLNPRQAAHLAAHAAGCTRHYLNFLSDEFSEMNLPIRTIRPWWHLEDEFDG